MVHFQAEGPLGEIGLDEGAMQVFGAEMLGLLLDVLHQHGPFDAFGKSGEVFDQRGER